MTLRNTFTTLAALSLSWAAARAQTPAEQLQKGIYAQETSGDLDAAIQAFRSVANGSPQDRSLAAEAQLRLVQTLLRKKDANNAAVEFGALARNYPDYAERATAAARIGSSFSVQTMLTHGSLQNNVYHHKASSADFVLAPGWIVEGDGGATDGGQMLTLRDSQSDVHVAVWIRPEESSPAQIEQKLAASITAKIEMNKATPQYRFRDNAGERKLIGGHAALSAVADHDGHEVSYYTWILTPRTHVLFIAYMTPETYAVWKSRVDQLVFSADIP